jgi:hypothetical protein
MGECIFLGKIEVAQLVKKFPTFMEFKRPLYLYTFILQHVYFCVAL